MEKLKCLNRITKSYIMSRFNRVKFNEYKRPFGP
uniref:Uncharacterized protein n=1 Tax=viral metagenome TaxID=1070528 RepID=A0A6C0J8Q1_9ZZZZ